MNKKELVMAVAEKAGLTRQVSQQAVNAALETIAENIRNGVTLDGFGVFRVKDVPSRQGRNPRTGEAMTIAAKSKVTFKAYKQVTEKL